MQSSLCQLIAFYLKKTGDYFKTGYISEVNAKHQEKTLSVEVYDQYVNYITDEIPWSHKYIVHVLFIQNSDLKHLDFEDIESVEVFSHQPLPTR